MENRIVDLNAPPDPATPGELVGILKDNTIGKNRYRAEFQFKNRGILLFFHNHEHMNGLVGTVQVSGPSLIPSTDKVAESDRVVFHLWVDDFPTWNTEQALAAIDRSKLTAADEEQFSPEDMDKLRLVLEDMEPVTK